MELGASLGPYRIDRELGSGGMGKVYAATGPDGVVALKVVHPHLLEQPGFFKRFLREADIGKSVRHDNVVRTLDCDQLVSGGQANAFLVMEYVEGQTLADLQRELDKVPEELCRHVAREICKGLAAIHAAGVVHRDLKPENVLITPDHVVKVMDLGIARLADEQMRLSQSGVFIGSVEYAAPEQFGGGEVDHRCDLHALGLLLYELSTSRHPYRDDDFRGVMKRVCEEEPRKLGEIHPQLSAFFEEVVHTLLAKRRDDRFADAVELLGALEAGEDSTWWKDRAKALRTTTRRPLRRIRIPRETAVYGREKELTLLRSLFERASSGEGQVALVEGEAGIGKSRLVDELVARLQADGEDLNFLFGSYPPGGAALASGGFSSAYRDHFGQAGSVEYLAQTPLLAPAFDALLRGEPAPSGVVALTRNSLGTCFVHATRNLAAERPTVVLIDDLHFAFEEARALFTALALAVPGHRLLLVGTMRPGVPKNWIANVTRLDHATHLDVPRLGPKDLVALLKDSFKSEDLVRTLGVQIGEKSDGNPFFAFEIIRGLREGQFITQTDDGTWASTGVIDEIQIPSSVLDLVNARVAGLAEDERNLLDVAACWGYEFDPLVVGEVLGIARIPLLRQLGQIERQHRLVRSSGVKYVFDHHQVQEALYGSLSELLRREYHAALAEALETRTKAAEMNLQTLDGALCVDLCEHYLAGARGESALRYLPAAQTHLSQGYLHAQVIALTERALAVPDLLSGSERARALLHLTVALHQLGRREREEECAREAERSSEEAGDEALLTQATLRLGTCLAATSRPEEAQAALRRSIESARRAGDQVSVVNAMRTLEYLASHRGDYAAMETLVRERTDLARSIGYAHGTGTANLGWAFHAQGRLAEARQLCADAVTLFRRLGTREGELVATSYLGAVFVSEGRLPEAQQQFERLLALSREIGDRQGEALASGHLGDVCCAGGRLAEAQEHCERSLALLREIGSQAGEAKATVNLGNVLRAQGRLPEAQEHYQRSLALSCQVGFRQIEATAVGCLGLVFSSQGRLAEAREHHERCLALSREIGHRESEAFAQHNLGALHREEGDLASSEAHYEACLAVCTGTGLRSKEAATLRALGSLRAAKSRAEEGSKALVAAHDLAREIGAPRVELLARCELALLPGGDAEDALAAYAEHDQQLEAEERREARLLLWKVTADRTHLDEAKRLLDEHLAMNPSEYHEAMCTDLRVNREILAAWREEFREEGDAPDGASP